VSARNWSSRTKDHCRIVIGPVSMPFITFFVRLCAYVAHSTVMGFGRDTSPKMIGGFTQREPYD
jgi:hypothetical protein